MMKRATKCSIAFLVIGVILAILGCVFIPVFHKVIRDKIKEEVPLKKGTSTYSMWLDPPVPIYFQIWVFDLVNPLEVVNEGAKPAFMQKGPYTYREHRKKDRITFHENGTISYIENRTFNFDREKSIGAESDKFTTVNLIMLTLAEMVRFEYWWIQELVELLLMWGNDNSLFMELSVNDIVWGYKDNLLQKVKDILKNHSINLDDEFGLFHGQNGSDDGLYTIHSGTKDVSKFALIESWNGSPRLNFWTTDVTNMINGTDGTAFPPFVDKKDKAYLFSSDICRSIYATYSGPTTLKGISLYHYTIPPETFLNHTENPANQGFCTDNRCLPSGLLNVSTCRSGAPVIMSQPNFLAADKERVIDRVIGLKADPKDHSTVLDIDPITGVVMNAQKKLQVNVYIEKVNEIRDTRNIDHIYFPVLWINESAVIDDKSANDYKSKVLTPIKITQAVQYGLIIIGALLILCAVLFLVRIRFSEKELVLKQGSVGYSNWIEPPVPIYFQIWVFDLVNPIEVVKYGAKPYVIEKGPYTYREHRKKIDITFEKNGTATYKEIRKFNFQREKSVGPENDEFTTANIAMVTLANLIRFEYSWITELTELILDATSDSKLFAAYKVEDIMWGMEDPLLKKVKDILKKYNFTNLMEDKIGIFAGQNNTDDGWYNVYTGEDDISKVAIINTWNGLKKLPYWSTDSCNMINGTDATLYPPFVKSTDTLYAYSTDICRSIYFQYKEKKAIRGIDLLSFYIPDEMLADIPVNRGFCTPADNCIPAGLLNVSNCKQEFAPIVTSQPHFYGANESVIKAVNGMHPTAGAHQTVLDVEPNTGIVMNVAKRLQVNIYLHPVKNIRDTEGLGNLFYPILWINESAIVDSKQAHKFKSEVQTPMDITLAVQYSLIVLGTFITISVLFYIAVQYVKKTDNTSNKEEKAITEE